jgi:hypothetical protein
MTEAGRSVFQRRESILSITGDRTPGTLPDSPVESLERFRSMERESLALKARESRIGDRGLGG